jgi:hypothetical protein
LAGDAVPPGPRDYETFINTHILQKFSFLFKIASMMDIDYNISQLWRLLTNRIDITIKGGKNEGCSD